MRFQSGGLASIDNETVRDLKQGVLKYVWGLFIPIGLTDGKTGRDRIEMVLLE